MNSINQLPTIYRIAYFLGARVEAFHENDWTKIEHMILSSRTKIRVHPEDAPILEQAKQTLLENHHEFTYENYSYFVPKIALKPGNVFIIHYGLGAFIQVNEDLRFKTMNEDEFKSYFDQYRYKSHHRALSYESIFGYPEQTNH